ncbi:hypothetical protein AB4Z43_24490 [Mesorhizobium sp. 2RAF45]|uniref:hypothetical protein n=1 Tax=Mesorhizobium TaxID=68287 RepID=UPI0011C3CD86|nr:MULTISPECIES: hypothetical protein [Mesorhizobium]
MHKAFEQFYGTKSRSKSAVMQRFSIQFLALGFLLAINGCDASDFRREILAKYSHPDVYVCSPSGFGQQSHCELKI